MSVPLRLEVRDYIDPTRWRWTLTSANGGIISDHAVRLDPADWQYEALTDLAGYLSWHTAPDQRQEDEAQIIAGLGGWIAANVLGPVGVEIAKRRPATVQVIISSGGDSAADQILFLPLELARLDGRPLGLSRISFVHQVTSGERSPRDVGERLRMLGVFSLPTGGQPLNLRRERQALVTLTRGIVATGKAADVRVLQYGVTREALRDVLADDEGWDIIHVSGQGAPGELLLETPGGAPDAVSAADLAALLDLARERLKMVSIDTCRSATVSSVGLRSVLGLPVHDQSSLARSQRPADATLTAETLAAELASRLICAVLAMRYPVHDEFAVEFFAGLYTRLIGKGQQLSEVIPLVLQEMTSRRARQFDSLSLSSPMLLGGAAADLRLAAPSRRGSASYDQGRVKMAGFPPPPERFVGRTSAMTQASAALARESGKSGTVLHGMPGSGKTACALELAYGHEHAFDRLVWYKAPDEGMDASGSLTDFAFTLERHLPGFRMIDVLTDERKLAEFLPLLTELMDRGRLLIVIDNAESLAAENGQWHDERWARVIAALTGHSGPGRLILTSRWAPAGLTRVEALPVTALSADEALLLASQLPHLRALIHGDLPGLDRETSRRLALGVLNVAQGHPKLLELANGQAAHPDRLAALVEAGDQSWREQRGLPTTFFATGDATESGTDYLPVLAAWTAAVADTLSPGERDLFWFLCCLEEPDRERLVLDGIWADLWQRLGRDGQPPDLDTAVNGIASCGLVAIRAGNDDIPEAYLVHAGSAAAGRDQAGQPFRDAADARVAAFWDAAYEFASGDDEGTVRTGLAIRAGLSAVPYLIRQQQWDHAASLLVRVFNRDSSRANAAAILPAIQLITRHAPQHEGTLAQILEAIDPAAGEARARAALQAALDRSDFRAAAATTTRLADRCRQTGRLAEALRLIDQAAGYTQQAGLGLWTQLADQVQRLQVLAAMGQESQVFAEVTRLRNLMGTLPTVPGPDETTAPWNVREGLLDTGRGAALRLGRWADALDLSAAILADMRDRHAPAADIARARFGDYFPLLRLGRTAEALDLLLDCRQAFQDARDPQALGIVLGALASVEDLRGHGDAAVRLARDALRYSYLAEDVPNSATSYHNLGNYLAIHAREPASALASHLAAALIRTLAGVSGGGPQSAIRAVATDLRELGTTAVPRDIPDLCDRLADIPGTDLPMLITKLSPDQEAAEQALRDLIAQAEELAATPNESGPPASRRRRQRGQE